MQVLSLKTDKTQVAEKEKQKLFTNFMVYIFAGTGRKQEPLCKIKDNNLTFWAGELMSWWVWELISLWVDELVSWWTCELMSLGVNELVSWWACELMSLRVDEITSWWVCKLVSWSVDVFGSCWVLASLQACELTCTPLSSRWEILKVKTTW